MSEKGFNLLSSVSLIVILFTTLFLIASKILFLELPDIVANAIGVAMIISVPVFVFTNVRKMKTLN